jgi:hypothetical protein
LTALSRERTAARQTDQEQLAAARAAADKATAELATLAQRLAEIAEAQTAEPPRRSRMGRAWAKYIGPLRSKQTPNRVLDGVRFGLERRHFVIS